MKAHFFESKPAVLESTAHVKIAREIAKGNGKPLRVARTQEESFDSITGSNHGHGGPVERWHLDITGDVATLETIKKNINKLGLGIREYFPVTAEIIRNTKSGVKPEGTPLLRIETPTAQDASLIARLFYRRTMPGHMWNTRS